MGAHKCQSHETWENGRIWIVGRKKNPFETTRSELANIEKTSYKANKEGTE